MMIDESLLQRMQLISGGQAFNRAYLFPLRLDGKHQTGTDRLAVYRGTAGLLGESPGPNRIACCGTLSQILTNPLRTACCGRALEVPTP